MEKDLQALYQMMEEEIRHHQSLLDEIQREGAYIRENSAEALIQSVHAIGEHTETIAALQVKIQQMVKEISASSGLGPDAGSLKSFSFLLPAVHSRKIRIYQNTLERLKKWILEINQRNKSFIQDSLSYRKDLFSLATGLRQQPLVYVQNGQKRTSGYQPFSLDRKA